MRNTIILQVYDRLQKLNLTMSHPQLLRLVDKLGLHHDARVMEWRDALDALMQEILNKSPRVVS